MMHWVGGEWRGLFETKAEETAQHCHMLYLLPGLIRGQVSGRARVDIPRGYHLIYETQIGFNISVQHLAFRL